MVSADVEKRKRGSWLTFDRMLLVGVLVLQLVIVLRSGWFRRDKPTASDPESESTTVPGNSSVVPPHQAHSALVRPRIVSAPIPATDDDIDEILGFLMAGHAFPTRPTSSDRFPPGFLQPSFGDMHRQMDRMLQQAMREFEAMERSISVDDGWAALTASPTMDMREDDNSYHIVFSLPGLDEAELTVTLEGRLLTVLSTSGDQARHLSETRRFERRIWLPGPVADRTEAKAFLTNGVLKVMIPRSAEAQLADNEAIRLW